MAKLQLELPHGKVPVRLSKEGRHEVLVYATVQALAGHLTLNQWRLLRKRVTNQAAVDVEHLYYPDGSLYSDVWRPLADLQEWLLKHILVGRTLSGLRPRMAYCPLGTYLRTVPVTTSVLLPVQ